MPYRIENDEDGKKKKIINHKTNEVVGRSDSHEKAEASIRHRIKADREKNMAKKSDKKPEPKGKGKKGKC